MKTELELITDLKAIVSEYVKNFTTNVISRKSSTVSSLTTVIAIAFQDENITNELLSKLVDYTAQNDRNDLSLETKKELGALDYEVILMSAEVFY